MGTNKDPKTSSASTGRSSKNQSPSGDTSASAKPAVTTSGAVNYTEWLRRTSEASLEVLQLEQELTAAKKFHDRETYHECFYLDKKVHVISPLEGAKSINDCEITVDGNLLYFNDDKEIFPDEADVTAIIKEGYHACQLKFKHLDGTVMAFDSTQIKFPCGLVDKCDEVNGETVDVGKVKMFLPRKPKKAKTKSSEVKVVGVQTGPAPDQAASAAEATSPTIATQGVTSAETQRCDLQQDPFPNFTGSNAQVHPEVGAR